MSQASETRDRLLAASTAALMREHAATLERLASQPWRAGDVRRAAGKEPLDRDLTVEVLADLWYHALFEEASG